MTTEKLKIKLKDEKELVAEINRYGADDEVELAIYVMDDTDKKNIEFQDICLVREGVNNAVECLVWADKDNEDYTDYFIIERTEE